MKFIFGLGNPGRRYLKTRHNLGMMVVKRFAKERGIKIDHEMETCSYGIKDGIMVILPRVYMNLSGDVINELTRKKHLVNEDLIVVHDDMDIEFSRLKLKHSGGSAGHKGVDSVIHSLGTDKFIRVRMGIGRPVDTEKRDEFVLSVFNEEELKVLDNFINKGVEAIDVILQEGIEKAMNKYHNRRNVK